MLGNTRLAHVVYAVALGVLALAVGVIALGAQGPRLAASAIGFVAALVAGAVDPHAPEGQRQSEVKAHAPPDGGSPVMDSTARPTPVNRRRSPR